MIEENKELLINFVKYNKFNKEFNKEKDEILTITIDFKLKNALNKAIKDLIKNYEETQADLYEANNGINDLLDIIKYKDKIIDDMAENYNLNAGTDVLDICAKCKYKNEDCHGDYCKDALIEYFKERCKQR